MTLPAWPVDLPSLPLRAGYGASLPDPLRRTDMEDGPGLARRKRLSVWSAVSLQVPLRSAAEVQALKAFWQTTLNCGQKRFTAPVWTFEGQTETKTCRFTGAGPAFSPFSRSGTAFASISIEVLDF